MPSSKCEIPICKKTCPNVLKQKRFIICPATKWMLHPPFKNIFSLLPQTEVTRINVSPCHLDAVTMWNKGCPSYCPVPVGSLNMSWLLISIFTLHPLHICDFDQMRHVQVWRSKTCGLLALLYFRFLKSLKRFILGKFQRFLGIFYLEKCDWYYPECKVKFLIRIISQTKSPNENRLSLPRYPRLMSCSPGVPAPCSAVLVSYTLTRTMTSTGLS